MSQVRHRTGETYEAGRLPGEIRGGIEAVHSVTVTVEDRATQPRLMRFRGMAAQRNTSIAEAVARIRSLRDDGD